MLAIAGIVALPGLARGEESASGSVGWNGPALTVLVYLFALAAVAWFWKRDLIRPGSFRRRRPAEAPTAGQAVPLIALMLGCMVLGSLASVIATSAFGIDPKAGLSVREMGLLTLIAMPVSLAAALGALRLASGLDRLPRFRLSFKGFGLGLLLAVVVFPVTAAASNVTIAILTALGSAPADAIAHDTLDAIRDPSGGVWRWVLITGAVLVTPVVEEILFRGLLQSALAAALPWRWGAVLGASALFTLAHTAGGVEAHSLPAIAVLGLTMGIAYERTGRVAVPIAMHVAFNGANVALAMAL